MRRRLFVACTGYMVLQAVLLAGVPIEAAPIYTAEAFVSVSAGSPPHGTQLDTGMIMNADTAGPVSLTESDGSGAVGVAFASVLDGTLHAFASGTAGTVGQSIAPGGGVAMARFQDTFTLTSSALAVGTAVDLLFTLDLSYTLAGDCSANASVFAGVIDNNGPVETFQDATCDASDFQFHRLAQHTIGEEFLVETFLFASVFSYAPFGAADAENGLRLIVTSLGDFSFTTASGNTYQPSQVAPVPEPASLSLLAAGLLSFAVRHRHHWKRSRR
jgi:hypothetical protein